MKISQIMKFSSGSLAGNKNIYAITIINKTYKRKTR